MERRERRHHTREFKLEAVRLAGLGDKTKAKVARELGIRVNQLRQWRLDFEEEKRNGVPREELATAEQDVGKLRRENAKLKMENEILKNRPRGWPRPIWVETSSAYTATALDSGRLLFGGICPRQKTWPRGSCGPSCGGTSRDPV